MQNPGKGKDRAETDYLITLLNAYPVAVARAKVLLDKLLKTLLLLSGSRMSAFASALVSSVHALRRTIGC